MTATMKWKLVSLIAAQALVSNVLMAQVVPELPPLPPPPPPTLPSISPALPVAPTPEAPAAVPAPRIVYVDAPKERAVELPPRENTLSLSLAPLVRPFVQVAYERRIRDWLGVGGLLGFGSIDLATSGPRLGIGAGVQVAAYPFGNFTQGMPIALELVYQGVTGRSGPRDVRVTANAIMPALTIGYKVALPAGFFFNTHLGLRWTRTKVTVRDASTEASQATTGFEPLLRVCIGYAF
jgi:hypothetical protein